MKIHAILHADFEKPAAISDWVLTNQHQLVETHVYRGEGLPCTPNNFDMLVVMGGPQSATDLDSYPYLRNVVSLIAKSILAHKPVLGICLGAQLVGAALGADAEKSPHKEVGIYPITLTDAAREDPVFKHFPAEFDVAHWHGDMPGLPTDSVLLAASAGCPRQAFRYGDRTYALQFHMEMNRTAINDMITYAANDLQPGKYVCNKEDMMSADYAPINAKLFRLLDYLAEIS